MSGLVKPSLDYGTVLEDVRGPELRELIAGLKKEVEVFYSRGAVGDVIANINRATTEAARTKKMLESMDLTTKSDDELISLFRHREEIMRFRALELIHAKVTGSTRITATAQKELIQKLRDNTKALVRVLNTKDMEPLRMCLIILIAISNDQFKHDFRKSGGLRPIAKLLSLPDLLDDEDFVVHLLVVVIALVTVEENREQFRTVNGLTRIIPFLSHKDGKIVLMATEALLNLSFNENNQPVIIAAHALDQIFKNAKTPENKMQFESVFLIRNLARCDIGKERLNEDHFRQLLPLLDPAKVYRPANSAAFKHILQLNRVVLECLFECAQLEKNRKILGQLGLLRTLQGFFLPMRTGSGAQWNFDVLLRVLKIIETMLPYPSNRDQFIELKGVPLVAAILQKADDYPEPVLLEAASILTQIATKATMNKATYGKLGLQLLIALLKKFPNNEVVHDLVAQVISNVSANQNNRQMVVQLGGDRVLMLFLRESRVKQVLVEACAGLANLCSEERVVKSIIQGRVVAHLIGLLQLNQAELQTNVSRVLANVSDGSDEGVSEIVKNGGIVPLVRLMSDENALVREQVLLTFGKLLFANGKLGPQNIKYFMQAGGERPLLSQQCMLAEVEEVQVPALSIIQGLTAVAENREILRDANLEEKLKELEKHPNVKQKGSQVANFLRLIKMNLKKDAVDARRERTAAAAKQKKEKKKPDIYMKVRYEQYCKLVPVFEGITFLEMEDVLRIEFGIIRYQRMTLVLGKDEVDITDQRSLDFVIDILSKEKGDHTIVVTPNSAILPPMTDAGAEKLDALLRRLDHAQLRVLLRDSIDQGADLSKPIREYITLNRKCKAEYNPAQMGIIESTEGQLYYPGSTSRTAAERGGSSRPLPTPGGPPPPPGGGPPPAPAPPPPPSLNSGSGKLKIHKKGGAGGSGGGSMDIMSSIKNAVAEGGLRKTNLSKNEIEKRGDDAGNQELQAVQLKPKTLLYEESLPGSEVWKDNKRKWAEEALRLCLMDYEMPHIVFMLLDQYESQFSESFHLVQSKDITTDSFVKAMNDLGFTVMFGNYSREGQFELIKEYSRIIAPYDLPMGVLAKIVKSIIQANGSNRQGGAVGSMESLLSASDVDLGGGGVVQGPWASGGSGGGLFDALDAMDDKDADADVYGGESGGGSSLFADLDAYEAEQGGGSMW